MLYLILTQVYPGAGVTEVVASEGPSIQCCTYPSTGRDIAVNSLHSDFGPKPIGLGSEPQQQTLFTVTLQI